MASSKRNKNKTLYIDEKAISTLAYIKAGLISPITKLMGEAEAQKVDKIKRYKDIAFPFSAILAPQGKRNRSVLQNLQKGEVVDFINSGKKIGEITIDEVFKIDKIERLKNIYGTSNFSHLRVKSTADRLGDIAISGEYSINYPLIQDNINRVKQIKMKTNAQNVSSMMLSANPLNRAHERIIRQTISESDLLVIFLRKPFTTDGLRFDIRYNSLYTFIDTFLPQNKVIIIPYENAYIFSGYNELILDALIAKNMGCNQLIVGKYHGGLGLFYNKNKPSSVFDHCKNINIKVKTIDQYVYCETCSTIVSDATCAHGKHHHVSYDSESIMKLIQAGLIPPSILVRKEVSANILAALFPERFEDLQEMYNSLMPGFGLIEQQSDEQFYLKLAELYQTSSLT